MQTSYWYKSDSGSRTVITSDKLLIKSKISITKILRIEIMHRINCHTEAEFEGITLAGYKELLNHSFAGEVISLYIIDPVTEPRLLFYGVIQDVVLYKGSSFTKVTIKSKSLTYMLDITKRNRSFQNTDARFGQIIKTILSEHSAHAIYKINDTEIHHLYIQYQETDWAFVKRLASRLNAPVIPEIGYNQIAMHVGLHQKKYIAEFAEIEKDVATKEEIYIESNTDKPMPRRLSYEYWSENIYDIGDYFDHIPLPLFVLSRKILFQQAV